ncbi:kinase-like domain-containing protein [Pavlovales sp. CCMP2436]|nr:kinase-like domain-containing protein [Pavlovales sp. CCMP2436]
MLGTNKGARSKIKLFIVMDYAEGGTLCAQIKLARERGVRISEAKIVLWIGHIALGLLHMHGRGILHRDLKTANIFLTPSGCIKIGDFGISKLMADSDDGLAHTTTGTPLYMSPEILSGDAYGYASDVWGLGCVLVELMTGEYAFKADNFAQLYVNIDNVRLANKLPEVYSQELRSIVPRLLARDEKNRFSLVQLLQQPIVKMSVSKWIMNIMQNDAAMRAQLAAQQAAQQTAQPAAQQA